MTDTIQGVGGVRRLMVNMPPRHGKSFYTSQYLPSWYLGTYPNRRVILTSYEASFAATWGRKSRNILEEHGHYFGLKVAESPAAADQWEIAGHGGGMMTAGAGGAITGKGADLAIIDDPHKNAEEANSQIIRDKIWDWYQSTLYTRLEPNGCIVVVQCMTGDTSVLMADGTSKNLRDIRNNDAIATHHEGKLTTSRVLNWRNNGPDRVFKIRMISGITVTANERHPFLVVRSGCESWVRLRELMVGDEIVRATFRKGHGKASIAGTKDAISQPNAKDIAIRTTVKRDGQAGSVLRPSILMLRERDICDTDMELISSNTMSCLRNKAGDVPSVMSYPERMSESIGKTGCASIMTTKQERFAGCCATTAILRLDTGNQQAYYSGPLSMYEITRDAVADIADAGVEDVFDIQVEHTENFIANGLVSHNTRWNEDDLSGRLLNEAMNGGEAWRVLTLPAVDEHDKPLWPERFDTKRLTQIKKAIGDYHWEALYQQNPSPREGSFFKVNKLNYLNADEVPSDVMWVRGWDFAATANAGDYTAGLRVGLDSYGRVYVGDMVRGQWATDERNNRFCETARMDGTDVRMRIPEDPGGAGKDQSLSLRRLVIGYAIRAVRVSGSKETRADPFSSQVNGGNVWVVRGEWNRDFVEELRQFPRGKHDDIVDASADAFSELANTIHYSDETEVSYAGV